jgi:DNA-binding SARP family transcriptional activator
MALDLSFLGKFQVSLHQAPVSGFVSSKVQALLCYLAVTKRPHSRETLAALLWGDMPDAEAKANLRNALSNLRKLVGDYIQTDRESAAFNHTRTYAVVRH